MVAHRGLVFVVEDEADLRETTEELLEEEGYLVLGARHGVEALSRMRGLAGPAVAIIDLMMPRMDGWDLITAMRADSALAGIRVIVLSSRERVDVPLADAVMAKPYVAGDLLAAVERLLATDSRPDSRPND